ncbi:MAG: hypothetical protein ACXAAQ_15480, partial [Candidatus Thorarchaeota archaeon]
MRKRLLFVIVVLLMLTPLVPTLPSSSDSNQTETVLHSKARLRSYVESPPMMIDGDLDFKNQANTSDWGGNGTEFNPFIITDLNITSQSSIVHLVNISHTRVFFILEANLFVGGSNGLRFTNVSNCIIR